MIGTLVFLALKMNLKPVLMFFFDWVNGSVKWIVIFVNWVGSSVGWIDDFFDAPVDWDASFKLSDSSEILAMIF